MPSMPEACCRFTSTRLGKRSHPGPARRGGQHKAGDTGKQLLLAAACPAAQTPPQTAPAAAGFKPAVLGALSCCTRTLMRFDRDGEAKHRTARLVRRLRRCTRHESRQWTCRWQGPCLCLPFSSYKTIQKGVPALRGAAPRPYRGKEHGRICHDLPTPFPDRKQSQNSTVHLSPNPSKLRNGDLSARLLRHGSVGFRAGFPLL
ncbi:hypothetical protein OKW35_009960 [Paraburkholderia sp. MM5477-R1]